MLDQLLDQYLPDLTAEEQEFLQVVREDHPEAETSALQNAFRAFVKLAIAHTALTRLEDTYPELPEVQEKIRHDIAFNRDHLRAFVKGIFSES